MIFHHIERTSPKGEGQEFRGTCILCSKQNLTIMDAQKECSNPGNITKQDAFIKLMATPPNHDPKNNT